MPPLKLQLNDAARLKSTAEVILGYTGVFTLLVMIQLQHKVRVMRAHRDAKKSGAETKPFDRYSSEDAGLLAADRAVGNFVEWAPSFLALFVTHQAVVPAELDGAFWGWVYVAARCAYPFLAMGGGITRAGARPLIFLSTVPGYIVLGRLWTGIAQTVLKA